MLIDLTPFTSEKQLKIRGIFAFLFILILFFSGTASIFAQEEKPRPIEIYSLGQQNISLSAGLMIPLFFSSFDGEISSTNLSLGFTGSLRWSVHLNNHLMLGAEIGGMICKGELENMLLMLPVTAQAAYIFHVYPFELPISLGIGMNVIKYEDQSHIDFILKPGFSSLWKYSSSWSFGLNFVYWWIFQAATGSQDDSMARMGHFLEITPTVQYNF